jgi:hypothetical protein
VFVSSLGRSWLCPPLVFLCVCECVCESAVPLASSCDLRLAALALLIMLERLRPPDVFIVGSCLTAMDIPVGDGIFGPSFFFFWTQQTCFLFVLSPGRARNCVTFVVSPPLPVFVPSWGLVGVLDPSSGTGLCLEVEGWLKVSFGDDIIVLKLILLYTV